MEEMVRFYGIFTTWGRMIFLLLLLRPRTAARARCAVYTTSWRAPRSGGRRAPRGLIPLGFPQREKDVALPLHSFFREVLQLQVLRAWLK
jgi:hypothetical protein